MGNWIDFSGLMGSEDKQISGIMTRQSEALVLNGNEALIHFLVVLGAESI